MNAFTYARAADADRAVATHGAAPATAYLGGGTNLVDLLKRGVERPQSLVDVAHLDARIDATTDGGLYAGAASRNADLAANPLVRERYPLVAQALLAGASPQLRNLATTGGNLLQRTRCAYFMDVTQPCEKRERGSGCAARDGFQREHAILGIDGPCIATHPSDLAVATTALDARVHLRGPGGARVIPQSELHRLAGDDPSRDSTLRPGELITALELPPPPAGRQRYRKARDRASYAFALVSVAAILDLDGARVRGVRLALGGVAHVPWRAHRAEAALTGADTGLEAFAAAADAELAEATPFAGNAFKVTLAKRLIVAVLRDLAAEAAA